MGDAYNSCSGTTRQCFRLVSGHEAAVNDVAVSNDGAKVVTCSGDKTVRVWDANSGTQLIVLATHAQEVLRLSRSPVLPPEHAGERAYSRGGREVRFDGDRRLVIATAARDCACHLLECNLGATLQTYGRMQVVVNSDIQPHNTGGGCGRRRGYVCVSYDIGSDSPGAQRAPLARKCCGLPLRLHVDGDRQFGQNPLSLARRDGAAAQSPPGTASSTLVLIT